MAKDMEVGTEYAPKDYQDPPPAPLIDPEELGKWSFYRAIIAEFIATLLFLYITVLTVIGYKSQSSTDQCGGVGILGIAWAFGGMIFVLVYCTAGISGGHINPAVTFGLFLARKVSLVRAIMYIVAQCLGAICGCGLVKAFQKAYYVEYGGGANTLNDGYSTGTGLGAEIIGTFVLVYTVFAATDPKRNARDSHVPVLAPLPIGFAVFMVHLASSFEFSSSTTMAAASPSPCFSKTIPPSSSKSSTLLPKSTFTFHNHPKKASPLHLTHTQHHSRFTVSNVILSTTIHDDVYEPEIFVSRFSPDEPRKGCDVLVEALEREGVKDVFAYPGGASMEIHQALTRSNIIRNVLPRHEQGGVFAAEGYARATGFPGVCIATSGPGATNLVSGLADALLDSIPIVAITGQVPRRMIGTDAFQETPIVEVTRSITKHNYLVMDVEDIPRVVREAFFLAKSGRPGPVLIDVPKDIQQQLVIPNWDQPMRLPGYMSRLPKLPNEMLLEQIVRLISESKKPVLYVGGGCSQSSEELRRFVELTGIPVASTLMGLGAFPSGDELSLQMLGMHGTVYANYAVDSSDLLLAFGVRFDDRVTGKLEAFASRAKIVHIDIDSAEIGKNKQPHVSICADIKLALQGLNSIFQSKKGKLKLDFSAWRQELTEQKVKYPLNFKTFGEAIPPQYAIQVLDELTNGNAIISTGVGQHQMWAAQHYKYKKPRQWLTSGGLGAMGFGLPAAIGAAVGRPGEIVVDIDGDGSFIMNVQELATIKVENLPVKIMLLNNQHLGMVVQWEDRFYKANRAHTYLGNPANEEEIFPNMLKFAEACGVPAARVSHRDDLRAAIQKMLDTPGPYLLDVIVPHQEHVLPMIPSGGAFKDVITEGDGRRSY